MTRHGESEACRQSAHRFVNVTVGHLSVLLSRSAPRHKPLFYRLSVMRSDQEQVGGK
jgi:hypothetical protein